VSEATRRSPSPEPVPYKVIAKVMAIILFTMYMGWMGWVSMSLVELSNKSVIDQNQTDSINELRKFHMEIHGPHSPLT